MNKENIFNTIFAGVGTIATWLFGIWDTPLAVLIVFIVLDYISGLIKGYILKELNSHAGFAGIAKKAVIFIVLIVSVLLDRLLNTGNWLFRTVTCFFYIANEGLSILENCCKIGLPVHPKLKEALEQLQNKN